jgi:2-polyprenyl-3-methyl-5-hydroxy-6-metoxy-1,4-benzoquinol methylase
MPGRDTTTLDFYAGEAAAYAGRPRKVDQPRIDAFVARLPVGAKVLELGCGAGHDSVALLSSGLDLVPTDGCAELAEEAEKRLKQPVRVLLFEDLDEQQRYDGVWANACLLHVPRSELPGIILCIHTALKPAGVFHATYKAGSQEGRDRFGRYYNYPSPEWLRLAYGDGWQDIESEQKMGSGYDREPTEWLLVTATKA